MPASVVEGHKVAGSSLRHSSKPHLSLPLFSAEYKILTCLCGIKFVREPEHFTSNDNWLFSESIQYQSLSDGVVFLIFPAGLTVWTQCQTDAFCLLFWNLLFRPFWNTFKIIKPTIATDVHTDKRFTPKAACTSTSHSCGRFRGVQGLIEPPFTHLLAPELTPLFLWNPSSNPSHNPQSTLAECTTSNSFRIIIFCPLYMEYKETCFNLKSEASIIFYLTS